MIENLLQCPTNRISFKLYDWNPAEFPRRLRHQVFKDYSHSLVFKGERVLISMYNIRVRVTKVYTFLQIFEWLSSMPVELEGYIRPGCTILTVFIAMPNLMWAKVMFSLTLCSEFRENGSGPHV